VTPASVRALLALAGRWFVPVALVARLPLAMGQIAVLLLVADRTGSFGRGGLAAAAIGVGAAVGAPVVGALTDRVGQRRVLLVVALGYAAGLLVLLALVESGAGSAATLVCAAAAGLFAPQVGPLARVRWTALARGRLADPEVTARLGDAFAIEGAGDEAGFVVGPALVGVLAGLFGPGVAPVVAAGLSLTAVTAFALHPTADVVSGRRDRGPRPAGSRPRGLRGLVPGGRTTSTLMLGGTLLGVIFGGTQVGVTSLAVAVGRPGAAGLVYALLGLGSALAGLASTRLPERFALPDRLVAFAMGLALLTIPMLLVRELGGAALAVTALGLVVAPYLIVLYALAERATSVARGGAVMTLLASSVVVGYSLGSSGAGVLADARGSLAAALVPMLAGWLALVVALGAHRRFTELLAS
jgi:predicted MFS family arabinose efflux permease